VTCISIARQQLDKHIPTVNTPNNREAVFYVVRATTVAMQWCCKNAGKNTGKKNTVFSMESVQIAYKEVFGSI
jgi:hypothetical protein